MKMYFLGNKTGIFPLKDKANMSHTRQVITILKARFLRVCGEALGSLRIRQTLLNYFKRVLLRGRENWSDINGDIDYGSHLSGAMQSKSSLGAPLRAAVHRCNMDLFQSTRGSELCSLLATANTATLCSKINGAAQKKKKIYPPQKKKLNAASESFHIKIILRPSLQGHKPS